MGGWRGGTVAAAGLVALQRTSAVAVICNRVLNGVMVSIGISSSFLIVWCLGFPFFILQDFLVGLGKFP